MLEYPQLTRAIYFTARAGRVIPEELFAAVATVLAFVFQLERAVADGLVPPAVDIPPTHRFDPEGRRQASSSARAAVKLCQGSLPRSDRHRGVAGKSMSLSESPHGTSVIKKTKIDNNIK